MTTRLILVTPSTRWATLSPNSSRISPAVAPGRGQVCGSVGALVAPVLSLDPHLPLGNFPKRHHGGLVPALGRVDRCPLPAQELLGPLRRQHGQFEVAFHLLQTILNRHSRHGFPFLLRTRFSPDERAPSPAAGGPPARSIPPCSPPPRGCRSPRGNRTKGAPRPRPPRPGGALSSPPRCPFLSPPVS